MNLKERERNLRRRYGITPSGVQFFNIMQGGKCGLCSKLPTSTDKLVIDHDHITGRVRGLLHVSCNSKLAWYEHNKERINKWVMK